MDENLTFIPVTDAASIAGVTKETIRNLCKAGTIRYQMHGNLYYPCKQDVEQYASTIAVIHSSEQEIERRKLELQQQLEQLRQAKADAQAKLEAINMFPYRIKHITELLCTLIPRLDNTINPREIEVIMEVLQGGNWSEVKAKLNLTKERTLQIWEKALEKIAAAPDELAAKDEIIHELQEQISELQDKKAEQEAIESLTPEERELLLQPIIGNELSIRAQNGLKAADINTLYDLVKCSRSDLQHIRNFGKKSVEEVEAWLASKNLSLKTV